MFLQVLKIVQVDGQVFSCCSRVHAGVRSSIKQLDVAKGFKMITAHLICNLALRLKSPTQLNSSRAKICWL